MGAMTMGFPVRDKDDFDELFEGARMEATVVARGHDEYYLDDVRNLGVAEADKTP
jgi:Cu/Ag efflux protein CusF